MTCLPFTEVLADGSFTETLSLEQERGNVFCTGRQNESMLDKECHTLSNSRVSHPANAAIVEQDSLCWAWN